jgi:ribonucleotide monophosphatase NagD (HAD superfamily)
MLLADHYARAGLVGARTIVLGTRDSAAYVEAAGGVVVAPDDVTARVLVCADDDGFPFLETMNAAITTLLRRLEDGLGTHLVLPNPDLVFPMGDRAYGLTAGAMAALIEAVLTLRDPAGGLRFVPLGKPHAPLFEAALARSPTRDKRRVVMLGDQLSTDIRGANDFGIDSVLVGTGVGRAKEATAFGVAPTWLLPRLGRP